MSTPAPSLSPAAAALPGVETAREKIQNLGHTAILWLGVAAFALAIIMNAVKASGVNVPTSVFDFTGTVGGAIAAASKAIDSLNAALLGKP